MRWPWQRPQTFAEYMATPAKRAQRDLILAMCDQVAESRKGVRYHVLAADGLIEEAAANGTMPACLHPIEQEPTDPGRYPGMHWWLIEDDDAPLELEGKRVELTLRRLDDGTVEVMDREVKW